jgi:hypothetical protein
MSWSTSKEKSHLLLPSLSGTPKAAEASISQDDPAVSRVKSGSTSSAAVKGGWYHGLEVYLFRILTETSMSVGWGRMLKDKRVRRAGCALKCSAWGHCSMLVNCVAFRPVFVHPAV